jgi:hypothetical protein
MHLERTFRRLIVTLSFLVLGLAVVFDTATLVPHTIVRVTLVDGRQATVHLQVPKAYVRADPALFRTLLAGEMSIPHATDLPGLVPERVSVAQIADVLVLRGPEYSWWADSQLTRPAVGLVVLLWLGFFVVRWMAKRIRSQRQIAA